MGIFHSHSNFDNVFENMQVCLVKDLPGLYLTTSFFRKSLCVGKGYYFTFYF